jgi:hypothetical protein
MRAPDSLFIFEKFMANEARERQEKELAEFLAKCKKLVKDYQDSEKCQHCKLRFKCYTE